MRSGSTHRADITPAMEDYLKAAYVLSERGEEITVLGLAQALAVTPPSVTGMVKRLAALKLLQHRPYQPITLTAAGQAIALEIVRHHRLLELYLAEFLGMPWEVVHDEADRLEHHISEELEERIAQRLGQPAHDPHGDPIPTRDLQVPVRTLRKLSELEPDQQGTVARIGDQHAGLLRYLGALGLVPGATVRLVAVAPYGGVVTVQVRPDGPGQTSQAIAGELAEQVLVLPFNAEEHA